MKDDPRAFARKSRFFPFAFARPGLGCFRVPNGRSESEGPAVVTRGVTVILHPSSLILEGRGFGIIHSGREKRLKMD
jgi:hypothetical protein